MKKIHKILFSIVVVASLMSSCDKRLDIHPTKELESNYFTDEERMQRGVVGVYAKVTDIYSYNNFNPMHKLWLLPGDDLQSNNSFPADLFKGLTPSNADVSAVWNRLYQLVARANVMLGKIEEVGSVYKNQELKAKNTGEMLFLRSWAFYKIWSWWGKGPIMTKRVVGLENVYHSPSQGLEMLDQAIADLELAATLLPQSWPLNESGRVTSDAAYGLLVKCYVTRACHNSKNAADYNKAIAAFEKISTSRKLTKHFGENFDYRFENNEESLFEFQASLKAAENPYLDNDFTDAVGSMGAFYRHFTNHWTNGGALVAPTQKLVNAFHANDPRKAETFITTTNGDWKFNGYNSMVKYINGDRNKNGGIGSIHSINNTRILRLADVKLLAAEAYLQTGQSDKALKQVNDIRQRARFSTLNGIEAAEPAALPVLTMQDIMDERMRELAGEEGIRWNDLTRWHKAGYINLATWSKVDFGFPVDFDKDNSLWGFDANTHVLMPIPLSEMDTNPLMMASGQNPGY